MEWHPVISVQQQTPDNDLCHFSISNVRFVFWAFFRKPEKLGSHTGSKWWPGDDPVPRLVHMQQSRSLVRVGSNDKRIDEYTTDRFTFADNHCRAFSVLSFCVGTTCFLVTVAFTIYYYAGSCIRPDAVSATHDLTADTKVWELGDWRGKNQGRQGRLRPVHYERAACSIACKSITGFHALFVTCTCLHRA